MTTNNALDSKTDIELYKDFLVGNKEAFDILAHRYIKPLILFIGKYTNNIEIAEDLVQDTFLYILINKKNYDFKYSLKTYLYTIAKCRTFNYLKKQKRIISFNDSYLPSIEEYEIDEKIEKEENKRIVHNAIKKLKPNYQEALYLSDFQGFQYIEICKILNKSMSQTKMLIHRARKALNNILKEENLL